MQGKKRDRRQLSESEEFVLGDVPPSGAGAMKYRALIFSLSLLVLPATMRAATMEHPGILHQEDNCSSCHTEKTRGRSVHSALAIPCTVCHLAQTQGDMTTLDLAMPKEQICFACHVKSADLTQHKPAVKGLCIDCHDAHNSDRRMLLREQPERRHRRSELFPSRMEGPCRTATAQTSR